MLGFKVILQFVTVTSSQITKSSLLLVIFAVIAPLSAFSLDSQRTSPGEELSSSTRVETSLSPQTSSSYVAQANGAKAVSIPGVQNAKQITFKTPARGTFGYFDAVNGSTSPSHALSKTKPIQVFGWAVASNFKKPADLVIITVGQNNTPIAVAKVNLKRPDIAKGLKNSALANSGWGATILPSSLSSGKNVIKAWAYNPQTKSATLLSKVHEIVLQ